MASTTSDIFVSEEIHKVKKAKFVSQYIEHPTHLSGYKCKLKVGNDNETKTIDTNQIRQDGLNAPLYPCWQTDCPVVRTRLAELAGHLKYFHGKDDWANHPLIAAYPEPVNPVKPKSLRAGTASQTQQDTETQGRLRPRSALRPNEETEAAQNSQPPPVMVSQGTQTYLPSQPSEVATANVPGPMHVAPVPMIPLWWATNWVDDHMDEHDLELFQRDVAADGYGNA